MRGLRHVSDSSPGISRQPARGGFRYRSRNGGLVRDEKTLARIRSLAIPPAWTDVWICPSPDGHLQATGRDARGRKQYRYHPLWRAQRDASKYERLSAFARALPRLRRRVRRDLAARGLPRRKVLATVARLLETTLIRVGNEEYARENGSFGLTTLRTGQVEVAGSRLLFRFRGKSGQRHRIALDDARLAAIVRRCRDLPGYELFQYVDEDGRPRRIESSDVNEYLREACGDEFTAKDFRTWAGSVLAFTALRSARPGRNRAEATRRVLAAVDCAAARLGNTRTVCRKCYVHPAVIDSYLQGKLEPPPRVNGNGTPMFEPSRTAPPLTSLSSDERALLSLLAARERRSAPAARRAA
jgi:DNA topoisomerase-1